MSLDAGQILSNIEKCVTILTPTSISLDVSEDINGPNDLGISILDSKFNHSDK